MEEQIENLLGIYDIQLIRIIIRPGPKKWIYGVTSKLGKGWERDLSDS